MNKLIHYGSVENIPFYNCSGKSDEEWYATGTKRPIFGWSLLIFGVIVEVLYIPVIYLMFKTRLVRHSCYKIIVLLGFVDFVATIVCCFVTGFLFIDGAVYCNYQTLIYIAGAIGNSSWCCTCACTLFLVINRVGDVLYRPLSDFLFEGKRIYFSVVIICVYWVFMILFSPSVCFNSRKMAWIRNPLVLDYPTPEILHMYRNMVQEMSNWIFAISTCLLYSFYCVLIKKMQKGQKSKASKQVFIQSSIICFFNTFTAVCYNIMNVFPTPPWVSCFGELCWTAVHGVPAIVYLTMNKTIRQEFLKLIGIQKNKKVMQNVSSKPSMRGTSSGSRL